MRFPTFGKLNLRNVTDFVMNIGEPAYWEERYKLEIKSSSTFQLFDWYCPFRNLYAMAEGMFDSTAVHKVLIIGVGRSDIIECLYRKGYRDITAIDISPTIILEMQRKYVDYSGVEFFVMDAKQLTKFSDETFSLVIEKACIDTLFCGTDFTESTAMAFLEIFRVMRFEGMFLSISHASALSRVPYYRAANWAIDCYKVPADIGEHLTLYAMTKTTNPELLSRKVKGAEAVTQAKSSKVVSNLDKNRQKGSTTRTGQNAGRITVTASVDVLAEMVADSAVLDS